MMTPVELKGLLTVSRRVQNTARQQKELFYDHRILSHFCDFYAEVSLTLCVSVFVPLSVSLSLSFLSFPRNRAISWDGAGGGGSKIYAEWHILIKHYHNHANYAITDQLYCDSFIKLKLFFKVHNILQFN